MNIFGIKLSNSTYKEFLKDIIKLKDRRVVFTPNPEMLLIAKKDKNFTKTLNKAYYLIPDGIGLYIAFQIKKSPLNFLLQGGGNIKIFLYRLGNIVLLPYYFFNLFFRRKCLYKTCGERVCGSDLTYLLLCVLEKRKERITIIDLYNPNDKSKVSYQKVFKEKVNESFPDLKIDYFIYNPLKKEDILDKIIKSKSKILFSTLGMKKQEELVLEVMDKCKNIKLGLGVGSSFDYITGFQKRAPKILRIIGLEWMYRLIMGPKKIQRLKRIWNAIFVFTWEVIKEK